MTMPISTSEKEPTLPLPRLRYPDKLILIIEPEAGTRSAFETILQEAGYHIVTLPTVEKAIAYFKQAHIDIVITDLFMPHQDGLKLLAQIKQRSPNTAVILTTAKASIETSVAALRRGAVDYLIKPIKPVELRQAVKQACELQEQADKDNWPKPIDELETLRAASELFLKNLSQTEVLSIIGERALQMSQADYCEIFTSHPDGKEFISTNQFSKTDNLPAEVKDLSYKLVLEAIQRQEVMILNPSFTQVNHFRSWLILPFRVSGNIVGALCLGHHQNRAFSPSTIKMLSIFVDQASIAISNVQLFEDLTKAYDNLARSRTEILESKNTLQTLFDGITDGLYIIDQGLDIIMVNQAEIERLQLPVEDVVSQTFDELGWQESAPEFIDLIRQTFNTGQKTDWIPPELNKSPLVKDREMHLYPIISPQKRVQQLIVLAQNVADQKQLQASLFQSANLAAIGQLATSIAHEINNPLTIALTNTQLSMMELNPEDELYEMMEDINYACNRIKDIITNLVDFSNQEVYQFDKINLIETIEDTLVFIGHPLRKAKIEVERAYHYTPTIIASRSHLKMAWMNLLLNACEAISATQKPGKITITTNQAVSGYVNINIADTGIGIPDHHFKDIFSPFFTTKPIGHSVGLGLFTVRTIIEKHQGTITFQSAPGATTFTTTLPENLSYDSPL